MEEPNTKTVAADEYNLQSKLPATADRNEALPLALPALIPCSLGHQVAQPEEERSCGIACQVVGNRTSRWALGGRLPLEITGYAD